MTIKVRLMTITYLYFIVPSLPKGWREMERHKSLSFVFTMHTAMLCPDHSCMLSVHWVLGLPLGLLQSIFPSSTSFNRLSRLFRWPKKLQLSLFDLRPVCIKLRTLTFVTFCFQLILPRRLSSHISHASNFCSKTLVKVQVSHPYNNTEWHGHSSSSLRRNIRLI